MEEYSIYRDIAKRTGGDIYIGVVGPVRTGKSTFIHNLLESVVIPRMAGEYDKVRALDEMPQSAGGRTIMTTEPKFIPDEAVPVSLGEGTSARVKLIDCVGYLVDGAFGSEEDGSPRMVSTPWSETPVPFAEAAQIGTGKVIRDHATVGVLVTTDGTFTDIPRENYEVAEARVAKELTALGKPFCIVLNSATPESEEARALAAHLEETYRAPVALVNCKKLGSRDFDAILGLILDDFPMREIRFSLPTWITALPKDHPRRRALFEKISALTDHTRKIGDVKRAAAESDDLVLCGIDAGDGTADMRIPLPAEAFYETLCEETGLTIRDEGDLLSKMKELVAVRSRYEKVAAALSSVEETGYGIVMPTPEELRFDEPTTVKAPSGWGVRLTARAESVHMIRAGICAEIQPVVGTKEQAEEVAAFLTSEMEENPSGVFQTNMFGKSLYDLVSDSLDAKLAHIPEDSQKKLGETLERILNEGSRGLICILL